MDEEWERERRIKDRYPDGTVGTGFSYRFTLDQLPEPALVLEIRMPTETLRLFFRSIEHFRQFVDEANVTLHEVESQLSDL